MLQTDELCVMLHSQADFMKNIELSILHRMDKNP